MAAIPAKVVNMALDIVRREGGFVDHPSDPGGPTKYGVTLATLRSAGLDKDGDGDVDVHDLRAITVDDAVRLFVQRYFYRPRIDILPGLLQPAVFDAYVHSGSNAVKLLQRVLNRVSGKLGYAMLNVDGVIGHKTAAAARAAAGRMGGYLLDAYAVERRDWLVGLARRNPKLYPFVVSRSGGKGGWVRRAEEFMRPRYRWTDDEWDEVRESLHAS